MKLLEVKFVHPLQLDKVFTSLNSRDCELNYNEEKNLVLVKKEGRGVFLIPLSNIVYMKPSEEVEVKENKKK